MATGKSMATDSMASPQGADSLDEWASEACMDTGLDSHSARHSGRAATLASLSEGETPQTTEGESNCEAFADAYTRPVEGSSNTDSVHLVPPSGANIAPPAEGHTGADSKDGCVEPVSAEADQVLSEECPSAPQLGRGEPSDGAEVKPETPKEAELPVVQAEKAQEEIDADQLSTTSSEPVVQAESPAYAKGADSADDGHTCISAPSPKQVSGMTEKPSVETGPDVPDDSPVFLSDVGKDVEDLSVDCKPLDFSSAREQWVRRDSSSSKPPTPAVSRTSSVSHVPDLLPGQANKLTLTEEALGDACAAIRPGVQQGEEMPRSPAVLQEENQEGQQVCKETPPMETVAGQLANSMTKSAGASPIVVKEPLTEAGAEKEGEVVEAERESGQTSGEREQTAASVHTVQTQEEDGQPEGEASHSTQTAQSTPIANAVNAKMKAIRMEDPYDDNQSDSGVSADFSAEAYTRTPLSNSPEPNKPPPNETPIEREIRLAAERELSLRQARGLSSTDKAQEFVEIPLLRPILSRNLPSTKVTKDKGKERQFAGKKMQREISQETQREQDLVQQGRVPGFYEKGTVRQLREKKQLFEAFQLSKETLASTSASQSKRTTWSGSGSVSDLGAPAGSSSATSTYSLNLLANPQSPTPSTFGPCLSESSSSQIIIVEGHQVSPMLSLDPNQPLHPSPGPGFLTEAQPVTVVDFGTSLVFSSSPEQLDEEEEEEVSSTMVRENPFFKLRPSMGQRLAVEQDIRQTQQRERELRKQRTSLYQWAEGGTANREIRSPTPDQNGLLVPQQESQNNSTTSSAQHLLGRSDAAQRKQTEAPKSPLGAVRSPRQKTPLVQLWEAGMVNGHLEEED